LERRGCRDSFVAYKYFGCAIVGVALQLLCLLFVSRFHISLTGGVGKLVTDTSDRIQSFRDYSVLQYSLRSS
jgi:hypothetical protein